MLHMVMLAQSIIFRALVHAITILNYTVAYEITVLCDYYAILNENIRVIREISVVLCCGRA